MAGSGDGVELRKRLVLPARAAPELPAFLAAYRDQGAASVAEPFRGITHEGTVVSGLFALEKTGVSTRHIVAAAEEFLASLGSEQRAEASFPVESDAWRRWSNIHPGTMRHGVCLEDLGPSQRARALGLLEASLSRAGFRASRDVMRLNDFVRAITSNPEEYGEWWYWLSIMGSPSQEGPWGWQIDGHHLNVNCFLLGDQMVMTPMFMGSEPVRADTGPYAGTRVFQAEEEQGLELIRALTPAQRKGAVLAPEVPREVFTGAFRDNVALEYQGLRFAELSGVQQEHLLGLVQVYVDRLHAGHDQIRMDEVRRHLDSMHFAWMGGIDDPSPFYYRLHSPVILIEFDHQSGIVYDNDEPSRRHIHTLVRTPNGNDYGRDLLRQHHARFDHAHPGHAHKE